MGRVLLASASLGLSVGAMVVFGCTSSVQGTMSEADSGDPSTEAGGLDGSVDAGDAGSTAVEDAGTDAPDNVVYEPCPAGSLRVFVTAVAYDGDLGGRAGGDTRCKNRADSAGYDAGSSWIAWLSNDTVNAIDLLPQNRSWCLVDDSKLVATRADLGQGKIRHPINMTESGVLAVDANNERSVWTGTSANGLKAGGHCDGWTKNGIAVRGIRGDYGATNTEWTSWPTPGAFPGMVCSNKNRLYCFQTN